MGHSTNLYPISGWFLTTDGEVESLDSRQHVDWLIQELKGTESAFAQVVDRASKVDIMCFWESKGGHGGPQVSPEQMRELACLGLSLKFDVYFPRDGRR